MNDSLQNESQDSSNMILCFRSSVRLYLPPTSVFSWSESCVQIYFIFEPYLIHVQVFYISKGSLKIANKQYSSLKNDYEMTLNGESTIIPCEDTQDVPMVQCNFVSIADLEAREKDAILGKVQEEQRGRMVQAGLGGVITVINNKLNLLLSYHRDGCYGSSGLCWGGLGNYKSRDKSH